MFLKSFRRKEINVNSINEIDSDEYNSLKELNDADYATWCNFAVTEISLEYGGPNLQYYNGNEYSTNEIYDNLARGYYNTSTHIFEQVDWDKAEEYASMGGLAIAVWKNPNPTFSGHIATLTGEYYGDNKSMSNLMVFQAGIVFGNMSYARGFRNRTSKFYIWRKR